ncbi:hypothetical protein TNCT_478131 [Trichonephila clavata]|uniref:Uncharacterized protein n=1 Tax=Trichonephila clavata TaxID=2740835 RepID=A0A8X6GFR7_TRICU|nr:hypothetical protein TNCT_478131 [Trichonephila clavata]
MWVQHIIDEHMTCLLLEEVDIDCEWGNVITKATVVRKQLDQGRYILGNQTTKSLKSDLGHNSVPRRKRVNVIQTRSQRKKEEEQKSTREAKENGEMKLEENLAEDIENLLPSLTEEKDTIKIKTNTEEFIKAQQESKKLSPSIQKVENDTSNEASDYPLTKEKLLNKRRKDELGDLENRLNIQKNRETKRNPMSLFKIFSNEPGKTLLVEHGIELINDAPIRSKPNRMSTRQADLIQEEIRKMLKY